MFPELVGSLVDTALHRVATAVTIGPLDAIVKSLADVGSVVGIVLAHLKRVVGATAVVSLDIGIAVDVRAALGTMSFLVVSIVDIVDGLRIVLVCRRRRSGRP